MKLRSSILLLTSTLSCHGQLTLTLVETEIPSIVRYELSGSSITSWSGTRLGIGTDILDVDIFSPNLGSIELGKFDISLDNSKLSFGSSSVEITHLRLQDESTQNNFIGDRFGVTTPSYTTSRYDSLAWIGNGLLDLSEQNALFSDLTEIDLTQISRSSGGPEAWAEFRLVVIPIPEASSLLIYILPLALLSIRRIRRNHNQTGDDNSE
ncbi:MAG: hypothetical protein ACSHYA_19790 [Opitutaceae bacterium]